MKRINEGEGHWREKNVSNQLKEKKKDRGLTSLKTAQHPKGPIRIRFEGMMTLVQKLCFSF